MGRSRQTAKNNLEAERVRQPSNTPNETSNEANIDCDTFGEVDGQPYGLHKDDRVHVAVFGLPNMGKSTVLFCLAMQNIWRGEGCTILDPHGDLIVKLLTRIPRSRWNKVIYIDPMTAYRRGKVVKLNFLDYTEKTKRDLVAEIFKDTMHKMYGRFWGPRLDMILTNALYVLMEQPPEKVMMKDIYRVITSEEKRNRDLRNVRDELVLDFWRRIFPSMPGDASSSVLTKIYVLIQNRILAPMFDCVKSSIDFRTLMDEGYIVLINLSEGELTASVSNFLGSMLLTRIYLAGMSRADQPEEERRRHYVYIDEAWRFTTRSMLEILASMRKYRVYVTLASQSIEQFQKDVALAIPSLCDTVVCFSAGEETVKAVEDKFEPYLTREQVTRLDKHYFAISCRVRGSRVSTVLKTIDYGFGTTDKEDAVRWIINNHGDKVDVSKYDQALIKDLLYPDTTPLSYKIFTSLFYEGEAGLDDIVKRLNPWHIPKGAAIRGLNHLLRDGRVDRRTERGAESGKAHELYYVAALGYALFHDVPQGPRAGGEIHQDIVTDLVTFHRKDGKYCFVDTGDEPGKKKPDILVYERIEPLELDDGNISFDQENWDTLKRFAIEVEAYPEKNPKHVYENYEKNRKRGLPVIFYVPSEEQIEAVKRALYHYGVGEEDWHDGLVQVMVLRSSLPLEKRVPSTEIQAQGEGSKETIFTKGKLPPATCPNCGYAILINTHNNIICTNCDTTIPERVWLEQRLKLVAESKAKLEAAEHQNMGANEASTTEGQPDVNCPNCNSHMEYRWTGLANEYVCVRCAKVVGEKQYQELLKMTQSPPSANAEQSQLNYQKERTVEELKRLLDQGWHPTIMVVKGREYIYLRRQLGGKREQMSFGPLTAELKPFVEKKE